MNVVACNSCGKMIGEDVASNEVPTVFFDLTSRKQPSHAWHIRCRPVAFRGFDSTRVHFCRRCLINGMLDGLHKQLQDLEAALRAGGAK